MNPRYRNDLIYWRAKYLMLSGLAWPYDFVKLGEHPQRISDIEAEGLLATAERQLVAEGRLIA